jgi:hypothetical protein
MLIQLTVRSKNFKVKTAYTESFEAAEIENLRDNQNTASSPALSGSAEFVYRGDYYTVTESAAYVTTLSGGGGAGTSVGAAATGFTAVEYGGGPSHRTVITNDADLTKAVASAALSFGWKLYDFPAGVIRIVGGTIDVTVAGATSTDTPEVGLGHLVGSGVNATLGAVSNDCESIFDGTAMSAISAAGTQYTETTAPEADLFHYDGTSTPLDLYLNFADTWTVTETLTFSAITVSVAWDFMGDV